jgi:hypothetical protein
MKPNSGDDFQNETYYNTHTKLGMKSSHNLKQTSWFTTEIDVGNAEEQALESEHTGIVNIAEAKINMIAK